MRSSTITIDGLVAHLRSAGIPIVFELPTERIRLESCFVDGSGLPCGMAYRGTIYVRPDTCSLSVLCHEYSHLWVAGYHRLHPEEWLSWVAGCVALPTYSLLVDCTGWLDRDRLADECLAVLVGKAVSGSCVADALAHRWVSRVLADCLAGVNPVGVVDDLPRCFFIGIKGARRLRWYDPEPYRMLSRARLMKRRGYDSYCIKMETSWEQGADFYWRYENNDYRLKGKSAFQKILDGPLLLKDLVDMPVLFHAYPQLAYYRVIASESLQEGHVAAIGSDCILFNREHLTEYLDGWSDSYRCGRYNLPNHLFHEIQHGIQWIEGFAKGASLVIMAKFQGPAMRLIYEIDPAICDLANLLFLTNSLELVVKEGLEGFRHNLEQFKENCNPNTYFNQVTLTYMSSIAERCDEEGFEALLRLLHAVVEQFRTPGWDDPKVNLYYRYAGEVEAYNVGHRMIGFKKSVLAEETEAVKRSEQIIAFKYCVSFLKQPEWKELSGKQPFL